MLNELTIENFAIISQLTLTFGEGLSVFSGETGAGKSIVIEALGFTLGARGDVSLIKDGADRLKVSATFTSDVLAQPLRQEYQITGDIFTLRRELDRKGKGKAYLDGRPITVASLSKLGQLLVDFHGQHDHQSLLHSSVHLTLLDQFARLDKQVDQFQQLYKHAQTLRTRLEALRLSEQEKNRLLDLYSYQLQEIEHAHPSQDEELQLEQNLPKLKHAGRLLELAENAYEQLCNAENSATARTAKAVKLLESMEALDGNLTSVCDELKNALTALEDASATLGSYKDDFDLQPDALDKMLERHEKLKRLKAKYGPELTDVLRTAQELKTKIQHLQHAEEQEQDLQNELAHVQSDLLQSARALHDKRMKASQKLAALITEQIRPLGFNQIKFSVSVEMDEESMGPNGADKVEFLFSPNPGQALRPLKNIASGGEISRVMLGLKTVLAPTVPVMVFDEVDAGIGGETGLLVGQKLLQAAQGRQVLCVTHLAQVAAYADHNFHVQKQAVHNTTQVHITPLDGESLTQEIARMLGGNSNKQSAAYSHAQELLQTARKHRNL